MNGLRVKPISGFLSFGDTTLSQTTGLLMLKYCFVVWICLSAAHIIVVKHMYHICEKDF